MNLFVEVDFAEVIERKRGMLGRFADEDPRYVLLEHDLLEDPARLLCKLHDCAGFSAQGSTVIVAECCFMYLPAAQVLQLLSCLAQGIASCHAVIYDPLLLAGDPFSEQMVRNFYQRGISLESHVVASQKQLQDGWLGAGWILERFAKMSQLEGLSDFLSEADRQQLCRVAALDEYEEWNLISDHYYLAILRSPR